ncbi:hypothetical protein PV04_02831 [Phialophora macrospora]|uniref:Copper acquisition factor BIM1-like domain-containing protein n=1 Tax=Phialophora macrospora TaxID=1851006 RepID=A0A0D2FVR4_9EURO|nr:hypothetical protein PV04_02831 [Phialophora macrospora]
MQQLLPLALLLAAQLVSGHFEIQYPHWRGDSFLPPASQYVFPCANVNTTDASNNNRTLWPLDGGSLVIDFHHPWSYVSFNLGFGSDTNTFNISLNPMLLNVTGNGTICIPKWNLPADLGIVDGMDASLQVINIGDTGTALYNCADIRFTSNATILGGDQCQNTTGVEIYPLVQQQADGSIEGATATVTVTASAAGASATNGAAMGMSAPGLGSLALSTILAIALILAS